MSGILVGRLALVTGASSGIGKAVCELFASEGASVVGACLHNTDDMVQGLNYADRHLACKVDVTNSKQVSSLVRDIQEHYSRPPCIAVNCAGITQDEIMLKMSEEQFMKVLNVNLKGTFLVSQAVSAALLKHQVRNASIINIASIVGKMGNIGQCNYAASKAGVIAFTKSTAFELARFGIRCNAILPGFIETAMTDQVPDKVKAKVRQMIPMQDFGRPSDIADMCLFLASDKSRYVTAASMEVTGGLGA